MTHLRALQDCTRGEPRSHGQAPGEPFACARERALSNMPAQLAGGVNLRVNHERRHHPRRSPRPGALDLLELIDDIVRLGHVIGSQSGCKRPLHVEPRSLPCCKGKYGRAAVPFIPLPAGPLLEHAYSGRSQLVGDSKRCIGCDVRIDLRSGRCQPNEHLERHVGNPPIFARRRTKPSDPQAGLSHRSRQPLAAPTEAAFARRARHWRRTTARPLPGPQELVCARRRQAPAYTT